MHITRGFFPSQLISIEPMLAYGSALSSCDAVDLKWCVK